MHSCPTHNFLDRYSLWIAAYREITFVWEKETYHCNKLFQAGNLNFWLFCRQKCEHITLHYCYLSNVCTFLCVIWSPREMEVCLLYSVSTERYWAPHLGRTYNFTRFSHYNLCNLTFAGFMGSNRSVTASGTARSFVSGTFQQQIRAIHKRGRKFLCFQSAPVFSQRQPALCKVQHSPQNNHLSNLRHPSTSAIYLEALSCVATSSSWDPAPNFSSSPL